MIQSDKAVVFCPGEVMQNFANEADAHSDRALMVVGRVPKAEAIQKLRFAKKMNHVLIIINYEAWYKNRAILEQIAEIRPDSIIADEAHRIKETDGLPFRGVAQIVRAKNSCPECGGELFTNDRHYTACRNAGCGWDASQTWHADKEYRSVKNVLMMTGTPVLNRPDELYALLNLVNEQVFPTKRAFIRDFCDYDYNGKLVWQFGGLESLSKKIAAYYIRRTKETAGIVLPPQTIQFHDVEFDEEAYPKQAKIMRMLREHNQIEIEEGNAKDVMSILAMITRERQASVWPGGITLYEDKLDEEGLPIPTGKYYADGRPKYEQVAIPVGDLYRESQKIDTAVELIERMNEDGHRVAVFSQFKTALAELESRLGERSVRFDGDTINSERDPIKDNFDRKLGQEPKWDNILCNYKSGGVGLNLTACTAIVVLDEEWNPGMNEQAYNRLNRIGQTEKTQVHVIRLVGAPSKIDYWMSQLIAEKAKQVGDFVEKMDEKSALLNVLKGM
jgi:SNF2 family DNA or RNA helicase